MEDYNMGLITNNERYNQIIDVWTNINTKLTKVVAISETMMATMTNARL